MFRVAYLAADNIVRIVYEHAEAADYLAGTQAVLGLLAQRGARALLVDDRDSGLHDGMDPGPVVHEQPAPEPVAVDMAVLVSASDGTSLQDTHVACTHARLAGLDAAVVFTAEADAMQWLQRRARTPAAGDASATPAAAATDEVPGESAARSMPECPATPPDSSAPDEAAAEDAATPAYWMEIIREGRVLRVVHTSSSRAAHHYRATREALALVEAHGLRAVLVDISETAPVEEADRVSLLPMISTEFPPEVWLAVLVRDADASRFERERASRNRLVRHGMPHVRLFDNEAQALAWLDQAGPAGQCGEDRLVSAAD